MVLQKFQLCDVSHSAKFEYCCIKDRKIFCSKCWRKQQHPNQCQSSRCGNYQKLAHLVINRVLELKNIYYLQSMSSSLESFQNSRIKSLELNYQITENMRAWIQQKVPLFLWSMVNQMLHSKYSEQLGLVCTKYDMVCTQMLKTIKNPEEHRKTEYLETIIANYLAINHEVDGNVQSAKSQQQGDWKGKKDEKVQEVFEYCRKNIDLFQVNTLTQYKDSIQSELSKMLSGFDSTIKFKGVQFPKTSYNQSMALFKKKQCYLNLSLRQELLDKLSCQKSPEELLNYNGIKVQIPYLQENPEELFQVGKSFIKQKLFSVYCSIESFKSSYPYKYSYIISTCLHPDEQYETSILQLEKSYLKFHQSKSKTPFLNSLSIIIMGPQMIVIRLKNAPQFCYIIKIYNYKKQRQSYYKKLSEILDLNTIKQRFTNQKDRFIQFTENMTTLQLAYAQFIIAYEQIFIGQNYQKEKPFEGQKETAKRGMKLFSQVVQGWKKKAKIELEFKIPQGEILQLMV